MQILVTGATGYIGSHLCKILYERGHEVVGIDKNLNHNDIKKYCTLIINDDIMNVKRLEKFDAVAHLAGFASVEESTKNPTMYYENNVNGTIKICRDYSDAHILFASTGGAFDAQSPYAKSKVAAEDVIKELSNKYTIFRFFNVAGSDGENMQVGESTHLIRIAAECAAGTREKMSIFGTDYETPDGTCIRDYIHVVDLANAIANAIEHGPFNTPYECIGSGKGYSVLEVLNTMNTEFNVKYDIKDRRAGDPPFLAIDSQVPLLSVTHSLMDMCRSTVEVEKKRKSNKFLQNN